MGIAHEVDRVGYVRSRALLSAAEVDCVNRRLASYVEAGHPGMVCETDGTTVRAIHGLQLYDPFFRAVFSDVRFLGCAEQFLQERCYIHQSKVNLKQGRTGRPWPWHQDFVYWQRADNVTEPRLLNVAVLLDDTGMESGPICLVPGCHVCGDLTDLERARRQQEWESDVAEDLTYQIGTSRVEELIAQHGVEHFTGKAGDVLFFHPLVPHSSSHNTSSRSRRILIITYNAISNVPTAPGPSRRPEFLCARDCTPLESRAHSSLVSLDSIAAT